jgi:hypothetical protein
VQPKNCEIMTKPYGRGRSLMGASMHGQNGRRSGSKICWAARDKRFCSQLRKVATEIPSVVSRIFSTWSKTVSNSKQHPSIGTFMGFIVFRHKPLRVVFEVAAPRAPSP